VDRWDSSVEAKQKGGQAGEGEDTDLEEPECGPVQALETLEGVKEPM
jgi:hypothetical protein